MLTFNIDDNKLELKSDSDSDSNLNLNLNKNVKFIDNIDDYMNEIKKLNKQIKINSNTILLLEKKLAKSENYYNLLLEEYENHKQLILDKEAVIINYKNSLNYIKIKNNEITEKNIFLHNENNELFHEINRLNNEINKLQNKINCGCKYFIL
jgi:chromosome segregation ATPase